MAEKRKKTEKLVVKYETRLSADPEHREHLFESDALYILEKLLHRERATQQTVELLAYYLQQVAEWQDTRMGVTPRAIAPRFRKGYSNDTGD
jgi:hypothetical protein